MIVAHVLRKNFAFTPACCEQKKYSSPFRRRRLMLKKAKSVPRGYRTVTPYLIIKDAASAIDYYKQAFKAKVLMCLSEPSGKVGHAEIKIGDSRMMLADEYPEMGSRGPQSFGGSPVSILLYVDDCDEIFNRAIAKGAKIVKPISDQFYGDRAGTLEDPFGHVWTIATHKEDLTSEEILQRAAARSG
jgi:PhnB protein